MTQSDAPTPWVEPGPVETAAHWWPELLVALDETQGSTGQRPVWTARVRESHQSILGYTGCPEKLYPLLEFYDRLGEAMEHVRRLGQPLGLVVLQLPELKLPDRQRRQRELEIALRLSVRRYDLPARLGPDTLAVALPYTGPSVGAVSLRLQRVLSRLAGRRLTMATACFPTDGSTALALLRHATWRGLSAMPGAKVDPELVRLLGPVAAPGA